MSHPRNKRERFLKGKWKGKKRAKALSSSFTTEELFVRIARLLRNTTKLCSCSMCRNPRRNRYNRGKARYTIQEIRAYDSYRDSMF